VSALLLDFCRDAAPPAIPRKCKAIEKFRVDTAQGNYIERAN
jgi:hypothetical protein